MAGYLKPAQGGYLVKQAIKAEKERKELRRLTKEITIQRERQYTQVHGTFKLPNIHSASL